MTGGYALHEQCSSAQAIDAAAYESWLTALPADAPVSLYCMLDELFNSKSYSKTEASKVSFGP